MQIILEPDYEILDYYKNQLIQIILPKQILKQNYIKYLYPDILTDATNKTIYKYLICVNNIINNEEYGIELENHKHYKLYDINILNNLLSLFDHCSIYYLLYNDYNPNNEDDDILDINPDYPRYKLLMLKYCIRYYYYINLIDHWINSIYLYFKYENNKRNIKLYLTYDQLLFYIEYRLYRIFTDELNIQYFTNENYFDEHINLDYYANNDDNETFNTLINLKTPVEKIIKILNISIYNDLEYYQYEECFIVKKINILDKNINDDDLYY